MINKLIEELKLLAESILKEEQISDVELKLDQARTVYEKLLILDHLDKEAEEVHTELEIEVTEQPEMEVNLAAFETNQEDIINEEVEENDLSVNEVVEKPTSVLKDEEPPMSLNDLFVPTFDGIKEDMSQKAEFKDTISLDDTQNLFQTKKEEPRQLSLNDKLLGSSLQVGLNDRIAFVNKLFNFSQSDFNKVLSKLNSCTSRQEALNYFQYQVKPNYNWKGKEELEERFVNLIERKFL